MKDTVMAILLHPRWDEISKLAEIFKLFKTPEDTIGDLAKLHGIPAAALDYPTEKPVEKFELAENAEVSVVAYENLFFKHYTTATGKDFEVRGWGNFRKQLQEIRTTVTLADWTGILGFISNLIRKKKAGEKLFGKAFTVADSFCPLTILNSLNWIKSEMSTAAPEQIVYGKKK